jgi:hypothetical protein
MVLKRNMAKGFFAVLLVMAIGIGIWGVATNSAKNEIYEALKVEIPMEQAVREVEVSIWETSNAIFTYLTEPNATSLMEYKKQVNDVHEFMANYKALIDTKQEKIIVAKFEKMWAESISQAQELIKLRDQITKLQENAWDAVHDSDDIIDYKIQAAFVEGIPDQVKKEKAIREVEVSIWEAVNATNYFIHRQFDKPEREFPTQLEDVSEYWNKYKELKTTPIMESHIKEFEVQWGRAMNLMKQCHTAARELKEKHQAFLISIHEVDDVVDFEIQEQLKKRIRKRMK